MTSIIAFDPGEDTGWACIDLDDYSLTHGVFDQDFHHEGLWKKLDEIRPVGVVCERFVYQNRPETPTLSLMSRNYIGVIELWCKLNHIPLYMQMAVDAKNQWPDRKLSRLKKLGVNIATNKHARDAMRHLFLWMMEQKNYYFLMLLKPSG